MSSPAVSVIIPTYNREALLPRAIESVIAQTFEDWEIVLVDDGSTDGTPRIARDCAKRLGDRLVYIPQDNRGSSAARNRGIDASRGRFVAFLDSDDEFLPEKLERQIALFNARPTLGLVYSDFSFLDSAGKQHTSRLRTKFPIALDVPAELVAPGLYACTESLFDTLIRGYFIATIVGMVRREVLGDAVRFDENQAYAEEWLFYLRVARRCPAGFVDEPLALHHFTESSLARQDKKRNTLRMHGLLNTIKATFPDMNRNQRRAVRLNLARTCRQLAYDATSSGGHGEAFCYAAEALQYEFDRRALACALGAAARWTLGSLRQNSEKPAVTKCNYLTSRELQLARTQCSE